MPGEDESPQESTFVLGGKAKSIGPKARRRAEQEATERPNREGQWGHLSPSCSARPAPGTQYVLRRLTIDHEQGAHLVQLHGTDGGVKARSSVQGLEKAKKDAMDAEADSTAVSPLRAPNDKWCGGPPNSSPEEAWEEKLGGWTAPGVAFLKLWGFSANEQRCHL